MTENSWSKVLQQRLSRRRALAASGATALGAALLSGCGGKDDGKNSDKSSLVTQPSDTSKQAKRGGTLKHVHYTDVQHLDPGFPQATLGELSYYVYSKLFGNNSGYLGPSKNEVVPDLGESWEFSPDGLTLTVKIRQSVKWHNKAPVNARPLDMDDILVSYNRLAEKYPAAGDIVNARNPNAPVLSFAAVDRQTVSIKLKEPVSYITAIFAYGNVMPIVPKETDSTLDIRTNQIGTGTFSLEKYTPSVSFVYARNPDYYMKTVPYLDRLELPIITEYAARLAQFKAGNIYGLPGNNVAVRGEDVIVTKQDVPDLLIYKSEMSNTGLHSAFGWLPVGKSPWQDERMRQAYSMSIDRDAWIDVVYNVSGFEAQGLPIETSWNTCISASMFPDGWLDPKGKDFGPNAKYFRHDLAEAKKLIAAAGYPGGLDFVSTYPEGAAYGADFPRLLEILGAMTAEAGLRPKGNALSYTAEFIPKYRDGQGQHEGVAYKVGPGVSYDTTSRIVYDLSSKAGTSFYGFSANGKNDLSGDPAIESLMDKAKAEPDINRRRGILFEIQRYMAKAQWMVMWPGGANGFRLAWPSLKNFQTYQGMSTKESGAVHWWLDDTLPPFRKA